MLLLNEVLEGACCIYIGWLVFSKTVNPPHTDTVNDTFCSEFVRFSSLLHRRRKICQMSLDFAEGMPQLLVGNMILFLG